LAAVAVATAATTSPTRSDHLYCRSALITLAGNAGKCVCQLHPS
jgi:hypothetical protein